MTSEKPDLRAHLFLTLQLPQIPQELEMRQWSVGGSGILLFPGLEISLVLCTWVIHEFPCALKLSRCAFLFASQRHPFLLLNWALRCYWTKKWRKPVISLGYLFFSCECVSPLTDADRISVPVVLLASSQVLPNKYITLEDDFLQLPGKLQGRCQLIPHMLLSDRYQTKV